MKKIGFIGMGNMGSAIAAGMAKDPQIDVSDMFAYDPQQDALAAKAEQIGFTPCGSIEEMLGQVDTVLIAIKPFHIKDVIAPLKEALAGKALVSIAAGWSHEMYREILDPTTRVQYIMPNTPAQVGEGMFMFEADNSLEAQEREQIMDIFGTMGTVAEVPSHLMDVGMAISGCGPAYIDLVIEALGDAGVKYGLTRDLAYKMASQTVLGTAKLQLETGLHPGVLKDNVCSPGGTTIRGVDALEHAGVRAAFIDAVDAVMKMQGKG